MIILAYCFGSHFLEPLFKLSSFPTAAVIGIAPGAPVGLLWFRCGWPTGRCAMQGLPAHHGPVQLVRTPYALLYMTEIEPASARQL